MNTMTKQLRIVEIVAYAAVLITMAVASSAAHAQQGENPIVIADCLPGYHNPPGSLSTCVPNSPLPKCHPGYHAQPYGGSAVCIRDDDASYPPAAADTVFARGTTVDFADLTERVGRLRGFVYVRVQGELLLMPVYTLKGDPRSFAVDAD
jgi:hypothetical protein